MMTVARAIAHKDSDSQITMVHNLGQVFIIDRYHVIPSRDDVVSIHSHEFANYR